MGGRTKLVVAYLGGGFRGWQRQPGLRTVQGELEQALRALTGDDRVVVVGAGRTDAGVHAAAQTAHVDLPVEIPPQVLPRLLNGRLEHDLRVRAASPVSSTFHARKSALGKHYAYRARWRDPDLPWREPRSATLPAVERGPDLAAACTCLVGRHDWSSFTVPEVAARGAVRTVFRFDPVWRRDGVDLHVVGEGFLRYQVRRMVGAVLAVARATMTGERLRDLLETPTPGAHLPTAPASGLCLERVFYRRSPRLRPPTAVE